MGYNQNGIQSTSHQASNNCYYHPSISDKLTKFGKLKEQGIILAIILGSILIISQLTTQAYARNITAYIHFNEQAIKEDMYLGDIRWMVDGKNYSNSYYDMSDAVYGDDPEIEEDLFTDGYSIELMVADNASIICFQQNSEAPDYKVCELIRDNTTEMHFTYPASWQPEDGH